MMIDLGQSFDHIPALLREAWDQIHEVAPGMREAIGQEGLQLFRTHCGLAASHIWIGGLKPGGPLFEQGGQIFPGMLWAGKEEGDATLVLHGKDSCGEAPFS